MSTDTPSKYPSGPRKSWGAREREAKEAANAASAGTVPGATTMNRRQRRAIRRSKGGK